MATSLFRFGGFVAALLGSLLAASANAASLTTADIDALRGTTVGNSVRIANLPIAKRLDGAVRLKRIDPYAADAKIFVVEAGGMRELPRSDWRFFVADRSDPASPRLSLAVSPDGRSVRGTLFAIEGTFALTGTAGKSGIPLTTKLAADRMPAGAALDRACSGGLHPETIETALEQLQAPPSFVMSKGAPATKQAVIAVDTDNSFMLEKFVNNTATATTYIAELFAAMNVMYESELDVRLVQGLTILRPSTTLDPFANLDTSASSAKLNEFRTWWVANQAATPRVFTMLLSGDTASPFSASGRAGVISAGNYCQQTASGGGGYSINLIFTSPLLDAADDASLVAHELGHNFGVGHTHCTNAGNVFPTGAGTLDQCYAGEAGLGCYSGAEQCPGNVEGTRGSIMSYCHLLVNGGSQQRCGDSLLDFHPVQQNALLTRVAANYPACITPAGEPPLFRNGFEN